LEEAERHAARAVDVAEEEFGSSDVETVLARHRLASLRDLIGKDDEADEMYGRLVTELGRLVEESEDDGELLARHAWAISHWSGSNGPALREAIDMAKRSLTCTAKYERNLARIALARAYVRNDQVDQAIAWLREGISERFVGWDGYVRAMILEEMLIQTLKGRGDLAGLEQVLREAIAYRRHFLPAGHPATFEASVRLGVCLTEQQRFEEAEALLLESYRLMVAHPRSTERRISRAKEGVLNLYQVWDQPDRADAFDEKDL
jgi:tetratricopeptide (TPR) repeat protein